MTSALVFVGCAAAAVLAMIIIEMIGRRIGGKDIGHASEPQAGPVILRPDGRWTVYTHKGPVVVEADDPMMAQAIALSATSGRVIMGNRNDDGGIRLVALPEKDDE